MISPAQAILEQVERELKKQTQSSAAGSKISVSPDLHPTLRKLKSNILNKRKDLPPEQKRLSQVHYMPCWPYICLKIRGQTTIIPDVTKESIVNSYLDMED